MRRTQTIAAAVAGLLLATAFGVAPAAAEEKHGAEAIENVAADVIADALPAGPGTVTATGRVEVALPLDASGDIVVSGGGSEIKIGLPDDGRGSTVGGLAEYNHGDGSATVPVVRADGSVQITTVIGNADAPERYSYDLGLPGGSTATVTKTGEVLLNGPDSTLIGVVAAPWALDASGVAVPTHYEMDGMTLIQVVDLSDPNIAYPVVADPQFIYFWWGIGVKFSYSETQQLGGLTDAGAASGLLCGLIASTIGAAACGAATIAYFNGWHGGFRSAAANRNCAQLNAPYGSGPALWITYEVAC